MAKKHKHEDHVNHEAWAIPYGDLVTLLLAFFVVMYAVSSVNEGKYRVLADAMAQAFGGPPKTISPLQLGKEQMRGSRQDQPVPVGVQNAAFPVAGRMVRDFPNAVQMAGRLQRTVPQAQLSSAGSTGYAMREREKLEQIGERVEKALGDLVAKDMVIVRRANLSLEIEIKADILFPSGSAVITGPARDTLGRLADIMREVPNAMRIEGHTDNQPISNMIYPSNWELSSARAASVVHLFVDRRVPPVRMSVVGFADQRPRADNETQDGRDANRRVVLVVMAEGTESFQHLPLNLADGAAPPTSVPVQVSGPVQPTIVELPAVGSRADDARESSRPSTGAAYSGRSRRP